MSMVTQRSELIDAGRVKEVLEGVTQDKYVLKTREELVHPDNLSWYLHVPVGKPSYISDAYEADGKIVFESPILYEVYQDMEYRFSESKYVQLREKLGDDVDRLLDKRTREKYKAMIPDVVRFLNEAESTVSSVNRENMTDLSLTNYRGSITVKAEVKVLGSGANEETIKRSVLAIKEAASRMSEWQDEQGANSAH
jgi:hypothetical protein